LEVLSNLIGNVIAGGPEAIVAILVLSLIATLIILRLTYSSLKAKEQLLDKKTERNEKLLDNYYEANTKVTEALNSVQIALVEIKSKL